MSEIPWTSTSLQFDECWATNEQVKSVPDLLATIFSAQLEHMFDYEKIYEENGYRVKKLEDYGNLTKREIQDAIRETMGYLIEELNEARNLLKAKPWKRSYAVTDPDKFKEELADAWHFFIELMILSGLTAEDVFQEYFKKSLINQKRRTSGY